MKIVPFAVAALLMLNAIEARGLGPEEPAPQFHLATNHGGEIDLKQYAGKVVYLDFWASWCVPCAHSLPWMSELQKKYGADGFQVIALNLDPERSEAEKLLQKTGADLLVAFDPEGTIPPVYDIQEMPSSFLIDQKGKIVARHTGFDEELKQDIEKRIPELLKKEKGHEK